MKRCLTALALLLTTQISRPFEAVLTDDTYVPLNAPATAAAGSYANLSITSNRVAMFKFDLTGLPHGANRTNVLRANLRLFVNSVPIPGSIHLVGISSSWTERTVPHVTFTSLPDTACVTVPLSAAKGFVSFDVTEQVRGWLWDQQNNGIGVTSAGGRVSLLVDSKENTGTGHPATLDIQLRAPGPRMQTFTNNGVWMKPPGVTRVHVKMWGGGGGAFFTAYGGPSGTPSGGGSGAYCEATLEVTNDVPVIVGQGGTPGADWPNSLPATPGGSISFLEAVAGGGGAAYQSNPGAGGQASGGDLYVPGRAGPPPTTTGPDAAAAGGSAPMGGGLGGLRIGAQPRQIIFEGEFPGGGGGAASGGISAAGAPGVVIVYY